MKEVTLLEWLKDMNPIALRTYLPHFNENDTKNFLTAMRDGLITFQKLNPADQNILIERYCSVFLMP